MLGTEIVKRHLQSGRHYLTAIAPESWEATFGTLGALLALDLHLPSEILVYHVNCVPDARASDESASSIP